MDEARDEVSDTEGGRQHDHRVLLHHGAERLDLAFHVLRHVILEIHEAIGRVLDPLADSLFAVAGCLVRHVLSWVVADALRLIAPARKTKPMPIAPAASVTIHSEAHHGSPIATSDAPTARLNSRAVTTNTPIAISSEPRDAIRTERSSRATSTCATNRSRASSTIPVTRSIVPSVRASSCCTSWRRARAVPRHPHDWHGRRRVTPR